jgi:hypothetical protein
MYGRNHKILRYFCLDPFYINFCLNVCYCTVHLKLLISYLLTPWCTILFEKLIVTQLIREYPIFLWNPKVHYRVHKSLPLDPILSQPNPVRHIDSYLPKVQLNVILPPTPRSYQWSLAFGPPNKNPVNTLYRTSKFSHTFVSMPFLFLLEQMLLIYVLIFGATTSNMDTVVRYELVRT